MTVYEAYKDVPIERIIDKVELLRNALEQIAMQCEDLQMGGEPQNGVPEFCRAILRGEDVTLKGILDAPHLP